MNVLADMLTALRGVFVLIILYTSLLRGPDEGLASVALLTSLAWITDVLDGPLARRARRPTRLGRCDLAADIGLTLALAACLIAWGILPFLPVVGGLGLVGLSVRKLRAMALLQLAMGMVYGTFILAAWQMAPQWGRALTGSVGLVVLLNPRRAWQQVTGFLDQAGGILRRMSSALARAKT